MEPDVIGFPQGRTSARSEAALEAGRAGDPAEKEPLSLETEFNLDSLPPMPSPVYAEKWAQSLLGCTLVSFIIALFVGITHLLPLATETMPGGLWWLCFLAIHSEAVVAYACLLGILFANPGNITRTPASCLPIPTEVADRIKQRRPMDGLPNLVNGDRTYCVRCLVWRPQGVAVHHCSTCQRCVVEFDHHCGVFGRCIAGKKPWERPFEGNMSYFMVIIGMAYAGAVTCFGFTVLTLALEYMAMN